MQPEDYTFVTGVWPVSLTAVQDFLAVVHQSETLAGYYQLHQTFSSCSLESLDPATSLDFSLLEQYRAFGPDWELWLRLFSDGTWRFRLICRTAVLPREATSRWQSLGCQVDAPAISVEAEAVVTDRYFLWGEPLLDDAGAPVCNEKGQPAGWYTTQIPQILPYPVTFPKDPQGARVCLQVENFLRPDGSVELVRYKGLLVE